MTGLPPDSIVEFTLSRMQASIEQRMDDVTTERSGLLFLGNVHDAVPRRLFLDTRLSPLDKTAWVMIRLYAQQNSGAVFPSYDELQLQLASPHAEKASRETVSRALLMLRITGWLSLCKRVRDAQGRVRGNIYAQHDEPLGCRDAEMFDPGWLDLVAKSCHHKNKSVRMTARVVLEEILNDPTMRHRHSSLAAINARLGEPTSPVEMAALKRSTLPPSSKSEPGEIKVKNQSISLSSKSELSKKERSDSPSSESEPSLKTKSYAGVRNSNCNVRTITHSVNKKTYVLPDALREKITTENADMLQAQLQALPESVATTLLTMLSDQLGRGSVRNPLGWMLSMLKRAREGALVVPDSVSDTSSVPARPGEQPERAYAPDHTPLQALQGHEQNLVRASRETVSRLVSDLRQHLAQRRGG
ncbi:STY4528 family pathogenicity island replication protein [Dickeya zeae]|uniref:STY4528 family pathogenicity island replication protein n=1 Tax=Dickeya zeae TaxID=204042 RepID=UPI001CF31E86|nr:STY4528 family pathogenicity island replication protein [Dickeya zeae]MCA6985509.1 helix-turn-helix domain-containing protein [Dickeya zeae]